jgi:hypothetical protein
MEPTKIWRYPCGCIGIPISDIVVDKLTIFALHRCDDPDMMGLMEVFIAPSVRMLTNDEVKVLIRVLNLRLCGAPIPDALRAAYNRLIQDPVCQPFSPEFWDKLADLMPILAESFGKVLKKNLCELLK